ncbi:MAG: Gfo/Idh/MocA family oxidoreductase [Planctomycetia bacterium]|nr:Gfo/Idh/MocA family oxidoreductase [Planctomycetia bacterium]
MASSPLSRRSFLTAGVASAGVVSAGVLSKALFAQEISQSPQTIAGFDQTQTTIDETQVWEPFTDRKIRVGIAGYGLCQFGAAFSFQDHPNVEIVAVTDLIPERCAGLAKACRCAKTYPSLEEMVQNDSIEAVFLATDAANHANHAILSMNAGKHVASAVPAVLGNLEDADRLFETVKSRGLSYMMFETSAFRDDAFASRQIYKAGGFGKMVFTEGEYYHYYGTPLPSFREWRTGLPPLYYPTHATGYYTCVTGNSFVEVSCFGNRGIVPQYQAENNVYKNPFGTEVALMRTSEGGMARMTVSRDTPGGGCEAGRNRGQKGVYIDHFETEIPEVEDFVKTLNILKPSLPPGVDAGGHGGSHGYLMAEFIDALLRERKPLIDIATALNTTVCGIVAHHSALKDGELMKIPQYRFE